MKETSRNRAAAAKRKLRQRKLRNRRIALTVCLMLVVMAASIGGTVAWLTAKTNPVVNTFTYGDINIALAETTGSDYKIIPGKDIDKNPKVTVKANSEACWLFVKVAQSGTFVANKVTYAIADGWTKGNGTSIPNNVYYRSVNAVTADTDFAVLQGNKIVVSDMLTKAEIKDITNPTLTFTAYAVQQDNIADAATAWSKIPTT